MFDKDGVISSERNDLSALQKNIQKENQELPWEMLKGADVF
jgi:hypothetical protein